MDSKQHLANSDLHAKSVQMFNQSVKFEFELAELFVPDNSTEFDALVKHAFRVAVLILEILVSSLFMLKETFDRPEMISSKSLSFVDD